MLIAEKWKWAFLNWEKVSVNNRTKLDNRSIISIENFKMAKYDFWKLYVYLSDEVNPKLFQLCSVLYAWLMLSVWELDAVIFPSTTNYDWAALKIIVEEAWWKMTDINWYEQRYDTDINWYIASNWLIHKELVEVIKRNVTKR